MESRFVYLRGRTRWFWMQFVSDNYESFSMSVYILITR
jgi:hypothetical protein